MSAQFPDTFIPFLDSLHFAPPAQGAIPVALIVPPDSTNNAGRQSLEQRFELYQTERSEITVSSFIKKLSRVLEQFGHVTSEAIATAILGCVVKAETSGQARLDFLENALTRFVQAELSHFIITPIEADVSKSLSVEGYTIGALNMPVLKSRCSRAQSDYAMHYEKRLEGRVTLHSPEFRRTILDLLPVHLDKSRFKDKSWSQLLLNYFEQVSRNHLELMWAHLDRTQLLSYPFGAEVINPHSLRSDIGQFSEKVSIYLNFSKTGAGYVVPESAALVLNQPGADSEAYRRYKTHQYDYRTAEVGDSELGRTIVVCSRFIHQAKTFLATGRPEEALLYATICLEHLFSEKQAISESVSARTAALTYLRVGKTLNDAKKEVRSLYTARSQFVHSGQPVTSAQAERLIEYAREVIRSLLVLHLKIENRNEGFLVKWIKNLGVIVSADEAGITIDPAFLAENGIFKL
jgi:hypothetical protein